MKNFRINAAARILLLVITIGVFFYFYFRMEYRATLLIIGLFAAWQIYLLIRYIELTNRELTRFLESIRYSDFSQSFSRKELGGSFTGLYRAFNDVITEFQKTRSEKEEQYRFVQTVMQHIGVGIITFTKDGRIEFINNSAKKLLRVSSLYTLDQLDKFQPGMSSALREIKPGEKVTFKIAAESELQQLIIYAAEFKLKDRNYTLISLQNILPELEEKEMQAWQNLIRVLTHEIMNSVTPISSLAGTVNNILSSGTEYNADTKDDIKLAVETIAKRSEALIHFVDVYRSIARTPQPEFEVFRVKELFDRIYKLMEPEFTLRKISFSTSIHPGTLDLTADAELVEQVLINLIINAIHALSNRPDPQIKLTAGFDNWGRVNISVTDNGCGIPEELYDKIFIPFYTTKKEGSGIGLNLSRQIMRSHGGSIRVTSEPDKGSTFTLRF